MQKTAARAARWLEKRTPDALITAIGLYVVVVSWLCFAKYGRLGYNGIDLAYFSQVFWNTLRGRFFQQSIHPHLSLGDHAELVIPLLAPFYALWQDPRTLLVLQTAALALGAWPAYLLARDRFGKAHSTTLRLLPLVFGLVWLLNPLVQNVNLFEFHVLALALTPLMFALVAYRRGRKREFLFWATLALLCREDVALVVMMFGALAWLERRPRWWRIVPFALGAAWFVAAMKLIGHFTPGGAYKYDVYYAWLGGSLPAVAVGVFLHPLLVAEHVLTIPNVEMILGFLLPYAFLPTLRPAALLLTLGPLAQILLGGAGGGEVVLDTHYATLFIPGLTLAAIEGASALPALLLRASKLVSERESRAMTVALVLIAASYSAVTMGPLVASTTRAVAPGERALAAADARAVIARIPPDAAVAASYSLMPLLSSRPRLYGAHYLFLGVTQFGENAYPTPADLRYTAFDLDELLTYRAQFLRTNWTIPQYPGGLARLATAAGTPVARTGRFALYDRAAAEPLLPESPAPFATAMPAGSWTLLGETSRVEDDHLLVAAALATAASDTDGDALVAELLDANGSAVRSTRMAIDAPPPATEELGDGRVVALSLPLGDLPAGSYPLRLSLERRDEMLVVDDDRSLRLDTKKTEPLGSVMLAPISVSPR